MKLKRRKERLVKILVVVLTMGIVFTNYCLATEGGIEGTKLVKGTENLITDLTDWLLVLAPTITALFIGYFLIRKTTSTDEHNPKWDNKIKTAIICCIGVIIASGLINVIVGYYK